MSFKASYYALSMDWKTDVVKRSPVTQLFSWFWYVQGSCLICLKHCGVLDLLIAKMDNFSPVTLPAVMPVSLSLPFFPPEHFSCDRWYFFFGRTPYLWATSLLDPFLHVFLCFAFFYNSFDCKSSFNERHLLAFDRNN